MSNNSGIIDNHEIVFEEKFKQFCNKITELKIAVGYFHVSGFNLVKDELKNIKEIKVVMGDETDENTVEQIEKGHAERIRYLLHNELECMDESDQSQINMLKELCDFIEYDKLKIRVYDKQKFHAKAYLFLSENDNRLNTAIIGSSNFSKNGMTKHGNIELNSIHKQDQDLHILNKWYESMWSVSNNFKPEMLKILKTSKPYIRKIEGDMDYLSPIELLKVMIYELMDGNISIRDDVLAEFQKIGYINATKKLEYFNGCVIADSVGLGKTLVGLQLIEDAQKAGKNVLLIVPKSVKDNWQREIEREQRPGRKNFMILQDELKLKIITITELSNYDLSDPIGKARLDSIRRNYQFVVIDEAHRFRNGGSFEDEVYHGNKNYANLSYLKTVKKQYVLLTATPLNNSILDLFNLLNIFVNANTLKNYDSALEFNDFVQYRKIQNKIKDEKAKDTFDLKRISDLENKLDIYLKGITRILEEVMILRTRMDISNKYPDLVIGGKRISFTMPSVSPKRYTLPKSYGPIYKNIAILLSELVVPHISLINKNAGKNLSGLYKILLFKRLESSIHSFTISLNRLRCREVELLNDIQKNGWIWAKKQRQNDKTEKIMLDNDPELEELSSSYSVLDDDVDDLSNQEVITIIHNDIKLIDNFTVNYIKKIQQSKYIYDDSKIKQLAKIINDNTSKKILVFSQYVDTIEYMYKHIQPIMNSTGRVVDCVTGSSNTHQIGSDMDITKKIDLFAPKANEYSLLEHEKEIDILLATDSIAEGVNLQDCAVVVNYDLPWNPMRIIQRVGRADRIGSTERTHVFNILPDDELDVFLDLISKLSEKIEKITEIIGKENYILSEDERIMPRTIGERIKKIKEADRFDTYEELGRNVLLGNIQSGEEDAATVLKTQSILERLKLQKSDFKKYTNKNAMYSIIEAEQPTNIFVMFRIYDKTRDEKIKNIIIRHDINTDSFNTLSIDNLRLDEFVSGISKKDAPASLDLDALLANVRNQFEKEYYEKEKEKFKTTRMVSTTQMNRIQEYLLDRLEQINRKQTLNPDDKQNLIVSKAVKLFKSFKEYAIIESDIEMFISTNFKSCTNKNMVMEAMQKSEDKQFVYMLEKFYNEHIKSNFLYLPLRNADDIEYKMICWGAFV